MPDLPEGGVAHVQGSAATPYELKNVGGVYSCTCPAWRNQSAGLDRRTCKHLKALRGEAAEKARIEAAIAKNPGAPATDARARDAATATPRAAAVKKDTAPPVLLAHRWENDVDLTGWWMSEKLDGVRAYWDGKAFVSRLGNAFQAPKWFVEGLPSHPLDGELWVGRKMFQETMSIVRRYDMSDDWKRVKYVLFDAPAHGGPFEARYEFLMKGFAEGKLPYCRALPQEKVRDMQHVKDELARVEALGGEGLMVRQPGSMYVASRSSTLLKIKSFFDAEGRVVGHLPGTGKHKGRLGALDVEMHDGTRFHVGTGFSDAERESPPAIGAIVTFRYQELSKDGVPRFPSYVCVREDLSWEQAKPEATRKAVNPKNPQGVAPVVKKKKAKA